MSNSIPVSTSSFDIDHILGASMTPYSTVFPAAASSQSPLFVDEEEITHRVVDEHITAVKSQFSEASPPQRNDYVLTLEFKSQVVKLCSANPRQWLIREREYLLEDQRRRRAFAKIAPAPYPPKQPRIQLQRP